MLFQSTKIKNIFAQKYENEMFSNQNCLALQYI